MTTKERFPTPLASANITLIENSEEEVELARRLLGRLPDGDQLTAMLGI